MWISNFQSPANSQCCPPRTVCDTILADRFQGSFLMGIPSLERGELQGMKGHGILQC